MLSKSIFVEQNLLSFFVDSLLAPRRTLAGESPATKNNRTTFLLDIALAPHRAFCSDSIGTKDVTPFFVQLACTCLNWTRAKDVFFY